MSSVSFASSVSNESMPTNKKNPALLCPEEIQHLSNKISTSLHIQQFNSFYSIYIILPYLKFIFDIFVSYNITLK